VRGITASALSIWALFRFGSAVAEPLPFSVPAGRAEDTLEVFSEQSGLNVIYDFSVVRSQQTRPVAGRYELKDALRRMLLHSGLKFKITSLSVLSIKVAPKPLQDASSQRAFADKAQSVESIELCRCATSESGTRLGPWCWAGEFLVYRPECPRE
jgi:hypothetical protein